MKPLKDILNESLLNKSLLNESLLDDEDEQFDRNYKTLIELWIKENYKIHGTLKIYEDTQGFVVDSGGNVKVTNKDIKSLANGMFRWGEITGGFNCEKCTKLRTLKGAPNKCEWFDCSGCTELKTLGGAPKKCDNFYCFECTKLRTLEGAPNECYSFNCSGCTELKSLKGAPNECNWFNCSGCTKLISLKGAPNECDDFCCSKCAELRSLEGVPVGTTIKCSDCTNLTITDNERKKYKIRL